jgi:hypothetical protein
MMDCIRADIGFGSEGDNRNTERFPTKGFLTLAFAQLQASLQHGDTFIAILSQTAVVRANGLREIVGEWLGGGLQDTLLLVQQAAVSDGRSGEVEPF